MANEISELRQLLGLTQPQFATELSVTRDAVTKWEAGNRLPIPKTSQRMAELASRMARECKSHADMMRGTMRTHPGKHKGEDIRAMEIRAERLDSLAGIFLSRAVNTIEWERELDHAMSYLAGTMRQAESGDSASRELLRLSAMGISEFADRQKRRMAEATKTADRDVREVTEKEIFSEIRCVETLRLGRRAFVERGLTAVRRQMQKLKIEPFSLKELERLVGLELSKAEGPADVTEKDRE